MRRLLLLLTCALAPMVLWSLLPVPSDATPSATHLSQIQSRLQTAQRRAAQRRGRERVLTTDVAAFSGRIRRLEIREAALSNRRAVVQRDLGVKQRALDRTQSSLREQRARRTRLVRRLRVVRRGLARRLVELYEADRPDVVTVVMNSHGFADLIERMNFLGRITDSDRAIFGTVRRARDESVRLERELAGLERRQNSLAQVVVRRRDSIVRVTDRVERVRTGLAQARAVKRGVLASVRGSRKEVEQEVSSLRAQQAEIRRTLQRAQVANAATLPAVPPAAVRGSGGGPMIWPVNGPITSPFCERRSYEACHPGIDIGVPEGTPIRAAAAGRVVLLQPVAASGGYGNYTCIQHTTTLSSCYAHQSRFGTSLGATVRQGQVIGFVGNTGHSFGAHLHWEVRVNGAIANPLNYL